MSARPRTCKDDGVHRFRILPDVRFRNFPPECVVLKQSSGEVLVVNEVGGRVLELLKAGATSEADMVDSLVREYDVAPGVLAQDVATFLNHMQAAQVIESE